VVRGSLGFVKAAVLPRGKRSRRLPLGIGRGITLDIDFSVQTKMFLGLYEIELNRHFRRLCLPGFNCLDVGAQFGYDALLLAKLSRGRVASFECDPDMYGELCRNVAYNDELRPHIEVVQGFVTSETRESEGWLALDDIVFGGRLFVPDFIKMDIEGGELAALLGARRILEEHHPNLLIETHSRQLETDCLALVSSLGYRTTIIETRTLLPDYRPAEHNRWFVASHASMIARATTLNRSGGGPPIR
jgi:hypothetical protein